MKRVCKQFDFNSHSLLNQVRSLRAECVRFLEIIFVCASVRVCAPVHVCVRVRVCMSVCLSITCQSVCPRGH